MTSESRERAMGEGAAIAVPAEAGSLAASRVAAFRDCFRCEATFRAFYDEALPYVYGYLFDRVHGDQALAEELTQATFVEAVRRRDSFEGRSAPTTWLVAIARHKLVDQFRADERRERTRHRAEVRELHLGGTDPWRESDEREALLAALGRLGAAQQAALVLHYADGLSVREVARALHRSEAAVESLLARGRDALRAAYEEAGDG